MRHKIIPIFFLFAFALAMAACSPSGDNPGQPGLRKPAHPRAVETWRARDGRWSHWASWGKKRR